jgi:hypothetical protein
MAINERQVGLLAAEDWQKVYQSFRDADFQSYDFATLRKAMIDYLQLYYPEDFNDFTESSEYIALIDLIAFMGQGLAFRADLNTRENFIDTAERRDSILRLARLVSYSPKRCIPANGFLKINSISTTENLRDSTGRNIGNTPINWNDTGNPDWQEQWNTILNAAMITGQKVGKPGNTQTLASVVHQEYALRINSTAQPVIPFQKRVDGNTTNFELVSPTTLNQSYVYEQEVQPDGTFQILYKNDNLGNTSNDTGYFFNFKQGELNTIDLNFEESLSNRVANINVNNINNTDIWLYSVDDNGNEVDLWNQVPSVSNANVIYNSDTTSSRKSYQITTRQNDQINLIFGDGAFSEIPQGRFRLYYRVSNGLTYQVEPSDISDAVFAITYVSKRGRQETLTAVASLNYTVTNANARETVDDIRLKAPQQYYTQNRMVNGEDYNIFPFTAFSDLVKVKAVNRTASGISRFLDVSDTSGRYSSTNIFCQDGLIYRTLNPKTFTFDFVTTADILNTINSQVKPALAERETLHFYYDKYNRYTQAGLDWNQSTVATNSCTGYLNNADDDPQQIGSYTADNRKYITPNSLLKFTAPSGKYFTAGNLLKTGTPSLQGDRTVIFSSVASVITDGANGGLGNLENGNGPVTLNEIVPSDAVLSEIIPAYDNTPSTSIENSMIELIKVYDEFGIGYDQATRTWYIIAEADLDLTSDFSLTYAKNTTSAGLDASWLMHFKATNQVYTATHRSLEYIYESQGETNFYFDDDVKIYDARVSGFARDQIKVLKTNKLPDSSDNFDVDVNLQVYKSILESDGHTNTKRVRISFTDRDDDGIADNPDFFEELVAPDVNANNKRVYFKPVTDQYSFSDRQPLSISQVISSFATLDEIEANKNDYPDGQVFFTTTSLKFYGLTLISGTKVISELTGYTYYTGRQNLYFQYRHNAPGYKRIDPSPSNIVDLFLLTNDYNDDYRLWAADTTGKLTEPTRPSSEKLRLDYTRLENFKSISDTIIYNSAKFKPLFGSKADTGLRATFKVVKNPNVNVSDSEIRVSVVNALNEYFELENWDFGETFFFSELSAYLHTELVPNVASIVIVPDNANYGNLQQITCNADEIFISTATVDQVAVVPSLTATNLKLG